MKAAAGTTGRAKDRAQAAAFASMIASASPAVQTLARSARSLILETMPDVIESVWVQQGNSSYGTGPKKMSEHFTYFVFAAAHLGFGFYYGAELDDPAGLLEGTGARMRHVKITKLDDLKKPAFKRLLKQATTHRVPPIATTESSLRG
jgi:hypothetical protein